MQGTELKVVAPAEVEILGPTIDRAPQLRTNENDDYELLETWLKANGSAQLDVPTNALGVDFSTR